MKRKSCAECGHLWPDDELLEREDNRQLVCPECSGLLADEDLSCRYDETG